MTNSCLDKSFFCRTLPHLENGVLLEDGGLGLVVAEGLLAVETLVEDDAHRPDVHLGGDLGRRLAHDEALRGQVPVGAGPLAGEVHALLRVVAVLVHDLGEAEVCNLNITADHVVPGEEDVARLEIVVDDRGLDLVEVLERGDHLKEHSKKRVTFKIFGENTGVRESAVGFLAPIPGSTFLYPKPDFFVSRSSFGSGSSSGGKHLLLLVL